MDVSAAYPVQAALITRRRAAGGKLAGRKIGLTPPVVQKQLGVGQPDFGTLLDDMAIANGDIAPMSRLIQPKVGGEIAFWLRADLNARIDQCTVRASGGLFVVSDTVIPLADFPRTINPGWIS
jgi:2-keto-4-pentenoate hydratase